MKSKVIYVCETNKLDIKKYFLFQRKIIHLTKSNNSRSIQRKRGPKGKITSSPTQTINKY